MQIARNGAFRGVDIRLAHNGKAEFAIQIVNGNGKTFILRQRQNAFDIRLQINGRFGIHPFDFFIGAALQHDVDRKRSDLQRGARANKTDCTVPVGKFKRERYGYSEQIERAGNFNLFPLFFDRTGADLL